MNKLLYCQIGTNSYIQFYILLFDHKILFNSITYRKKCQFTIQDFDPHIQKSYYNFIFF